VQWLEAREERERETGSKNSELKKCVDRVGKRSRILTRFLKTFLKENTFKNIIWLVLVHRYLPFLRLFWHWIGLLLQSIHLEFPVAYSNLGYLPVTYIGLSKKNGFKMPSENFIMLLQCCCHYSCCKGDILNKEDMQI
jgi:hypothetical protein